MERREQYDPEDIESLLTERSFDELLAEERAFVLRHLSSRDEYEQMRALLHYVRPDERSRPTIEPEDRVRVNVLAAFRAQQQPQWRVWLNSIVVWLVPREAFAIWRPALAFGSLALLIMAGVVAVRQFGNEDGAHQLAEVKQVNALQEEKAANEPAVRMEATDSSVASEAVSTRSAAEASSGTASASSAAEPPPAMLDLEVAETKFMERVEEASSDAVTDAQAREDLAAAVAKEEKKDMLFSPVTTGAATTATAAGTAPTISHVVTQDELVRNESVANVSEVSKVSKARKRSADAEKVSEDAISASRSLGQDPALMGLINSGW